VAAAGGTPNEDVTMRTSLSVVGDGFREATTLDDLFNTSKALKAWRYRERGQRIEFWSEVDFVEALTGANVARNRAPETPSPTYPGDTVMTQPSAARRPQQSAASGAAAGDLETLICFDCGARWQRPRSRARRPGRCPACSANG
jgi:hypothetical protein